MKHPERPFTIDSRLWLTMHIASYELRSTARTLGLVVDAVSEVCNVNANEKQPAPDFGAGIKTDFVKGLATVDKRMVILLDIDRLVSEGLLGELSVH